MRKVLRKFPRLYSLVRSLHILETNIVRLPIRVKRGRELKQYIKSIKRTSQPIVWHLCIPIQSNLGDYAQYKAIQDWVKENFSAYKIIELPSEPLHYDYFGLLQDLKGVMQERDIIVFQSGYTSTDLHMDEEVHRRVVKMFVDNVVIFFPQTVNYSSDKEANKTALVYNNHTKLLFLARDKKSFSKAREFFVSSKVYLYPDIVASWIGNKVFEKAEKREGILFCIRNDSEKFFTDKALKKAFRDIIKTKKYNWTDTTLPKGIKCSLEFIEEFIYELSKYDVVVTDRFHGTIFSLIAETPVVVLKTADHKVTEGANWFINIYPDYIRKADTLEEASYMTKELMSIEHMSTLVPIFKEEYYAKLKDLVIQAMGE